MAYSDFTLRGAVDQFGLTLTEVPDLLGDPAEVEPGPLLRALVPVFLPLAEAISTEKARSELLIAPILAGLRAEMGQRFSVFSGIDFTVDAAQGLAGFCDFLLSSSPMQQFLTTPVAAIVEAKKENIPAGLGQCAAAMVAVRLYNEREGRSRPVYGAVTSGTAWRFLRLDGAALAIDQREYYVRQLPKLVGALAVVVGERAGVSPRHFASISARNSSNR